MHTLIENIKPGFGAKDADDAPKSQLFNKGLGTKGTGGEPKSQLLEDGLEVHAPVNVNAETSTPLSLVPGPRERALEHGMGALSDADLLAILLGTGLTGCPVLQLANALVARFGGLEGIARLGPRALAEHPGMGMAKALRVAAGLEAGRRSIIRSLKPRPEILTSTAVAEWFTSRLGWKDQEELWLLSLDGRHGMRSARRVAQGGLHGVHLTARDVLTAGLQDAAAAVILVHNHPSGDPMPSREDMEMTHRVSLAGRSVGMPLIDHVIVSSTGRYTSMLDLGMLPSN
ncbi:MAG TPA: DNA repair protein RadC [Polyangium sp.]|nr:DNA repair protein RadC [Polyangium sp.]